MFFRKFYVIIKFIMELKNIRNIKNLKGKKVLLRVEFNVPLKKHGNHWVVADDRRMIESLPTITFLLKQGCRVALLTWVGRPDGKIVEGLRTEPIAKHLSKLLKHPVQRATNCIGPKVFHQVQALKTGELLMLENVRFYPEEMKENKHFSKLLTHGFDLVVFDAFGTIHRVHSSTTGITKFLPTYAGFLMAKEVLALSKIIQHPKKPLVVVLGGAKISDKIYVLKSLLKIADTVLLGGGLVNVFLKAAGTPVGKSFMEDVFVDAARRKKVNLVAEAKWLLKHYSHKIALPLDMVAGSATTSQALIEVIDLNDGAQINKRWMFLDIGPKTISAYTKTIKSAKTIFFNGPMGVFELEAFAVGTKKIATAIAQSKAVSVLGGGDTEIVADKYNLAKKFTHVSTGGGASMAFIAGQDTPVLKRLTVTK